MKLREYAEKNSISYQTAWRHFRDGLIPNARQLPTGTIVVIEEIDVPKSEKVALYARVSSSQNKTNLDSQLDRLRLYSVANGYQVKAEIKEIGSGLNDSRPKLLALLSDPEVTKIVVEHKDRLTRFGFRYIEVLLARVGVEIEVVNEVHDDKEDIVQDLVSIITSFCARIYGRRRSRRNTERLIRELGDEKSARNELFEGVLENDTK